jgi:hypothetical protein
MKAPPSQTRESAETLAIQVLAFIAEEPDRLEAFLAATGLTVQRIRAAARERDFLGGVLEHVLADERLLLAFTDSAGLDPAEIARAHDVLARR